MKKLSMKVSPFLLAAMAFAGSVQSADASAEYGNRIIKPVTKGNDVAEIQKDLKELNFYKVATIDGIYGPYSKQSVVAFQKSEGIAADGIVGPQTKSHLASAMTIKAKNRTVTQKQSTSYTASQQPVQPSVKATQNDEVKTSIGQRIAEHALRDIGIPYAWGGNTHKGFDCSGFVLHLLNEVGINGLPRDTASIFRYGTSIDRSQLQVGDIVFFKNTYKPGISHMGVYIGNNSFVHAGDSGIEKTSLTNSYFGPRYAGAKRF